jgi:4-amino-4-deoxy-L-arabinose transferase-like glycosyltransferase
MDPPQIAVSEEQSHKQALHALYAAFALLAAGVLVYSQTMAFHWDEGFHFLTAHLIDTGKRPYLDFFFPQTPLNAYWNAAWMGIFGPSWRAVHAVAALATFGSVLLIAQYLFALFPDRRWQPAVAFATLALFGLHSLVWEYGSLSQAYPLCLLLVVAAFRVAIAAVGRARSGMSALAGVLAGAAVGSSLLTAAASPVLLIWMWLNNRAGNRWTKVAAFVAGAVASCTPVLVLLAHGPHQVIFDILKYHSIYRRVEWEGATGHDIGIVTDWLNGSQSLLLVLLAVAGLFFSKKIGFEERRRSEFRLCLWLALAIGGQNLFAHPTFPQYFVFMIPFLTVLGAIGFYAVAVRLGDPDRPRAPVIVMVCIAVLCLGNSLYDDRDSYTWRQLERVADKVKEITPKGAPLLAPEQLYVLARWPVPPGMEHDDAHKLQFTPAESARLHILPKAEVDRQIKAGDFPTTVVCDDDRASELEGWNVYSQKADLGECTVFWQFKKNTAEHPILTDAAK